MLSETEKSLMLRPFVILAMCLMAWPVLADLLICPECTNQVSSQAIACPKCGAPIEFIKATLAKKAALLTQDRRTFVARIETDQGQGFGVAVQEGARRFLVFDAALIECAESLIIHALATNDLVAYQGIEIADTGGLTRLPTDATNLVFLHLSPLAESTTPTLAVAVTTTHSLATNAIESIEVRGNRIGLTRPVPGLAAAFAGTNLIAVAVAGSNKEMQPLSPGVRWIAVKPADFRKQTRFLSACEKSSATDADKAAGRRRELQSTSWLTTDLRRRAATALERMNQ